MNAHPLRNRILVRQDAPDYMVNGIHVPEGSETYNSIATVVEVGPGLEHLELKPGDRVFFSRQANSALIPDRRTAGIMYGLPEDFKDLLMLKEENVHFQVFNERTEGLFPIEPA